MFAAALAAGAAFYAPQISHAVHRDRLKQMSEERLRVEVSARPADVDARYQFALALGRSGQHLDAIRELLTVLQRDPLRPEALNDLGALYLLEGRYYESLVSLRQALAARPNYALAYANLGRLHVATKMPFTAARELQRAVELDPNNIDSLIDLGEAYQRTLNYSQARQTYERVLKLRPNSQRARIGLGKTLFSLADYAGAESTLRQVLAANPSDASALSSLGRLKLETATTDEQLQAARDLLRQAVRSDAADPEGWYDLGRVAVKQRKPAQAVEFFRRATQLSPDHPGAHYQLGMSLQLAGKEAEGRRVLAEFRMTSLRSREQGQLEEQLYQNPKDWDAMARLAEIDLETGQLPIAALRCQQLGQGAPTHPKLPGLIAQLARKNAAAATSRPSASGSPGSTNPLSAPPSP